MNIAIEVSPLHTGHKVRGTGFYLHHLREALTTYHKDLSFSFFQNKNELKNKVDIIHYPYFDPFSFSVPFFSSQKVVVTVHDLTPLKFPEHFPAGIKGSMRWIYQKNALRRVDAVITDSECSKNDILKLAGVDSHKIHVVYLAAGEEFIRLSEKDLVTFQEKYGLPDKFLLYVGDATWNKNVPMLIDAVKSTDIPLVIVGKVFEENKFDTNNIWNKDLVKIHSLLEDAKNVKILGFIPTEDLVGIYNAASALVMPSLYEGFGLPILEAMQSGCPVITTNCASLPEIAGNAALYVDPHNRTDIVNAMEKVMSESNLRKELEDKGRKQASKFSWKKTASETVSVYKSLL